MPAPPAEAGAPRSVAGADADRELWLVDLAASGPALLALEARAPRLGDDDALRAARTDADAVARGGLAERQAAYIALRVLLEAALGCDLARCDFARSVAGRPHLAGHALDFSLSHTAGFALVGIARHGTVGVDLERPRGIAMAPSRRAALEAAGQALAPAAPLPPAGDLRTLAAWVRIEAFAKAHGQTVARVLTALGVIGGRPSPVTTAPLSTEPAGTDGDVAAAATVLAALTGDAAPPRAFPLTLPDGLVGAAAWSSPPDRAAAAPVLSDPPLRLLPADRDGLEHLAASGRRAERRGSGGAR